MQQSSKTLNAYLLINLNKDIQHILFSSDSGLISVLFSYLPIDSFRSFGISMSSFLSVPRDKLSLDLLRPVTFSPTTSFPISIDPTAALLYVALYVRNSFSSRTDRNKEHLKMTSFTHHSKLTFCTTQKQVF